MSAYGMPAGPKPPTRTVAPSGTSATAASASSGKVVLTPSSPNVLEDHGETLPDADADGRHAPAVAGRVHPVGERAEDAAAGGAERVADGDGTTTGVDDLGVDLP